MDFVLDSRVATISFQTLFGQSEARKFPVLQTYSIHLPLLLIDKAMCLKKCWKFVNGCVVDSLTDAWWPRYLDAPYCMGTECKEVLPGYFWQVFEGGDVRYCRIDPGDNPIVGEELVVAVNLRLPFV